MKRSKIVLDRRAMPSELQIEVSNLHTKFYNATSGSKLLESRNFKGSIPLSIDTDYQLILDSEGAPSWWYRLQIREITKVVEERGFGYYLHDIELTKK